MLLEFTAQVAAHLDETLQGTSCPCFLFLPLVKAQPPSQSSSSIPDVTSPVKLVGKISARFQASSGHSDSANWPGYEAGESVSFHNL